MPERIRAWLEAESEKTGLSMSELIRQLLDNRMVSGRKP